MSITYQVVAVDLETHARRVMTTGKTKDNAEAHADMAVIRRGCDREMFYVEPDSAEAPSGDAGKGERG